MKSSWRFPNLFAYLAMLVANGLASLLPLNNQTTAEISGRYPVLFTPAGYVFSIWGVIYLLLLGYVIYQASPAREGDPNLAAIGPLFFVSSLFNAAWIFAWHYNQLGFSALLMLGLLGSLIGISLRQRRGAHWLIRIPFGVYLGWISVATIANISVLLYDVGWGGWGLSQATWTVIMIGVGCLLATYAVLRADNKPLGFVFIWALIGIGVGRADTAIVRLAANAAAALVAITLLASFLGASRRSSSALGA